MHLPLISFLTELWHLLDISAVAGHGAVLAMFLLGHVIELLGSLIVGNMNC